MLLTRVMSALIGAPLFLYLVYRGGVFVLCLTVLLSLLALRELFEMASGLKVRTWKLSCSIAGLILIAGAYLEQGRYLLVLSVMWLFYCLFLFVLNYPQEQIQDVAFNFFSVNYIFLLFAHLVLLRNLNQGIYLAFLTFGLTWATDTGAYLVGRALGRHKLAPLVSPNKTVEGAVGGIVFAVTGAVTVGILLPNQGLRLSSLIILAVIVAMVGQLGDLVESSLKRFLGVKDSGRLIPGHGGVLDRFDSMLFTVPAVYYLFWGSIIS